MTPRTLAPAILLTLAACASAGTGSTATSGGGNTGSSSNGNATSGSGFSGSFTPAAAVYEGNFGGVDQGMMVINLLSQAVDCATWQDVNSTLSGTDMQIVLYGSGTGQYRLLDPNQSSQASSTGIGVDVDLGNDNEVIAESGTATVTTIQDGNVLTGSLQITWNDNETLAVNTFSAQYCPDTNNWGGTFAPQSGLFMTSDEETIVLLFDQDVSCEDYQDGNVPYGVTTWEIIVGGADAGTYALMDPNSASTGDALAYELFSNASVTSQSGNVTLSNVTSTGATIAVPSVTWSSTDKSTLASYNATYCDL